MNLVKPRVTRSTPDPSVWGGGSSTSDLIIQLKKKVNRLVRVCPGQNFANATVWLTVASILSAFKITHAVDPRGDRIDVSHALSPIEMSLW